MEIKPFKDLKVTTMTQITYFTGKLHLGPIFCLLPITRIEMPIRKRKLKKVKIPHCDKPGSILSLRYRGLTRGIFRTISPIQFRNSITLDISTKEKNVSLKLSDGSIHITGAKTIEMGQEAINYLFKHIRNIQEHLNYINTNKEKTTVTTKWLFQITKGSKTKAINNYFIERKNAVLNVIDEQDDHFVYIPTEKDIQKAKKMYEEYFDEYIARFFLQYCPEFLYHSQLIYNFENILETDRVIEKDCKCGKIYKCMANYSYRLNFNVNRYNLKEIFDDVGNGWTARYDPKLDHQVTIQVPYEVPEEFEFMRKNNSSHCHTFMVQRSGVVTQSGPDEEMMESAYYDFMNIIKKENKYIEKTRNII